MQKAIKKCTQYVCRHVDMYEKMAHFVLVAARTLYSCCKKSHPCSKATQQNANNFVFYEFKIDFIAYATPRHGIIPKFIYAQKCNSMLLCQAGAI